MSYYLLDPRNICKGSKILNRPILTRLPLRQFTARISVKKRKKKAAHLNELAQLNESSCSFKEKCFDVVMGVNRDKREGLGHCQ